MKKKIDAHKEALARIRFDSIICFICFIVGCAIIGFVYLLIYAASFDWFISLALSIAYLLLGAIVFFCLLFLGSIVVLRPPFGGW